MREEVVITGFEIQDVCLNRWGNARKYQIQPIHCL